MFIQQYNYKQNLLNSDIIFSLASKTLHFGRILQIKH